MIWYSMVWMVRTVWYRQYGTDNMVWYGSMRMKITNLCWLLGCWGPVIGEVGVVGLVHHLAAHALTPTNNPCLSFTNSQTLL